MTAYSDAHGLPITAANEEAVRHYDKLIAAYLGFARDTGAHLKAGRFELARALLSERTINRPASIWGWRQYAQALEAFADRTGAENARATAARLLAA
jgi:predicted Zn-dependent protease